MKLRDLRARKTGIINAMQAVIDASVDGAFTASQQADIDRLKGELAEINDVIDAAETAERELLAQAGTGTIVAGNGEGEVRHAPRTRATGRGRAFCQMFPDARLSADGWRSADDFLRAVFSGRHHDALQVAASAQVGSGPDGGFLVPTEYAARMLDMALENEIVRPRAQTEGMQSDTKIIAGVDASSSSGGTLFGGVTGEWLAEGGASSLQDIKFRRIKLTARKLCVFTKASREILADGTSMQTQIEDPLISGVAWHLDDAFLNGTGAGQPLGVLRDQAIITVDKEGGQVADSITYVNLANMFARLHPACISNSVWVAHTSTIPQLLTLSLPIGTSGAHIPVMTQSGGEFQILTRPVLFTEKLPALGDSGDILLADFSQYVVGLRQVVTVEASQHVYWTSDESAFRATMRVDGQGKWAAPYTPKTGATLSWCVKLEAR